MKENNFITDARRITTKGPRINISRIKLKKNTLNEINGNIIRVENNEGNINTVKDVIYTKI